MDIATIIGFCISGVAVGVSIALGGSITIFYDLPSVVCVIGGCFGGMFIKFPIESTKKLGKAYKIAFFPGKIDNKALIEEIQKLADTARRESVFALEKVPVEDKFLKKAVTLAADNRPPEVISSVLQLEIDSMGARHKECIDMLDGMGVDGPSYGMLGTLIGLVQMLQNLSDPKSIGPAMAVAILTTFYGSVIANVATLPIKNKLIIRDGQEKTKMAIIVAGTLGIVAGENPRVIREKLDSFLPPNERFVPTKE